MEFQDSYLNVKVANTTELTRSVNDALLNAVINRDGKCRNLIESFNDFVQHTLPDIIYKSPVILKDGQELHFTNFRTELPSETRNRVKVPVTPKMCRDESKSYTAEGFATPTLYRDGISIKTYPEIFLMYIPAMLGSVICHLYGKTSQEIIAMGECPNDCFSYFVINGTERNVITQEKLRVNIPFITLNKDRVITCRVTTVKDSGTSNITIYPDKVWGNLQVVLKHMGKDRPIGIFTIFKILGMDDETAVTTILRYVHADNHQKVRLKLQSSLLAVKRVGNVFEKIRGERKSLQETVNERIQARSGKGKKQELGQRDFENPEIIADIERDVFPNIEDVKRKLEQFSMIVARLVETLLGIRPLDPRDSWGNKRLVTAGKLFEQLFNTIWIQSTKDLKTKLDKSTNLLTEKISTAELLLPGGMLEAFKANAWGVKGYYVQKGITDTIKRETAISIFSQCTRVTVPVSNKVKLPSLRIVQNDQGGYICIVETPEGKQCGLVKSLALTAYISIGQSNDSVDRYIEETKEMDIQHDPSGKSPYTFTVNGEIRGWVGQEVHTLLIKARREHVLPKDCCIYLNHQDRMIEYYCDGSRPVRPLLVVLPDGTVAAGDLNRQWLVSGIELLNTIMLTRRKSKTVTTQVQNYLLFYYGTNVVEQLRRNLLQQIRQRVITQLPPDLKSDVEYTSGADQGGGLEPPQLSYQQAYDTAYIRVRSEVMQELSGNYSNVVIEALNGLFDAKTTQNKTKFRRILIRELSQPLRDEFRVKEVKEVVITDEINAVKRELHNKLGGVIFETLLERGHIEYIDAREQDYVVIAPTVADLSADVKYTHCEIHPLAIFGIAGSLIPQSNSQQGPRSTYQAAMYKQALGLYHYNSDKRFDSSFKILDNPSRPIFEITTAHSLGLTTMPTGTTLLAAFMALPSNNEDGITACQEYLDMFMNITKYTTHKLVMTGADELIHRPAPGSFDEPWKFDCIDKGGFPIVGTYAHEDAYLVGRIKAVKQSEVNPSAGNQQMERNISLRAGVGEEGYIHQVRIEEKTTAITIKVKVRQRRRQQAGDKIASRYAQKGTFSVVVRARDLPRIASGPHKDVVPDIFINPHSIPSRMTMGLMKEMLASLASLYSDTQVDATTFADFTIEDYLELLAEKGQVLKQYMVRPNGRPIKNPIYVAPIYYQALRHHVLDKSQVRGRGERRPLNHQPVRGRSIRGGIRFGEMERDTLISHGATELLLERLMYVSDKYEMVMCRYCYNIAVYNPDGHYAYAMCKVCKGQQFGVLRIPYIFKLIMHTLLAFGVNTYLKTQIEA